MAKVFYESLAIHFQGTQEKPWQPSSKPTRKIKNLCRSWSDPTQWGKRASHKTRSRSESGANSTSGGHETRVARRQSLQGVQAGTGQNETRRESAAQRSARPKPTSVGVRCVLHQQTKKPSRLILKQPRLAYYSYMPPDSPDVSALKQLLKPTEDEQWGEFTTARVRCAEAQRAAATAGHDWLDYCTCMCCVKALFYHCTKDDECHVDASADPCSCLGPGTDCAGRWGILGVLSACMPCLLCYPLIQAANRVRRK